MDLTEIREIGALKAFPPGATLADQLMTALGDGREPRIEGDSLTITAAASILTSLLRLACMANDMDPGTLQVPADRGPALAKAFVNDEEVLICCDHCSGLMTTAIAHMLGAVLAALHGDQAPRHWRQLADALLARRS